MEDLKDYINEETVVKDEIYNSIKDSIICQICKDIMINPMKCMECPNSFCIKCIEKWNLRKKTCPNRCQNPNYKFNRPLLQILSNLKFECKKCKNIINYDDMIKHINSKCGKEVIDDKTFSNDEFILEDKEIFEKIDDKKIILECQAMKLNCK